LKVITGNLSTSRKFDERTSLSRASLWVRMPAAWVVASTDAVWAAALALLLILI
jgi:hypothetical protein